MSWTCSHWLILKGILKTCETGSVTSSLLDESHMNSQVKLMLSLCLMLPDEVSGHFAFDSMPVQLVQRLLRERKPLSAILISGSHRTVSEKFSNEIPKEQPIVRYTTTDAFFSNFRNIFSRNKHYFHELFQKMQFELYPSLKI